MNSKQKPVGKTPKGKQKQDPKRERARSTRRKPKAIIQPPALPTVVPALLISTQVSTTITLGFLELFDNIIAFLGYSRSEAIRRGMRMVMRECAKEAKVYLYLQRNLDEGRIEN